MTRQGRILATALGVVALMCASSAAAVAAPYEPNDNLAQAFGPLTGGTDYEGTVETANDVDYFYFNTVGQRQLDISLTQLAGDCGNLTLLDADGNQVTYDDFESTGVVDHLLRTVYSRRQLVMRVGGYQGCAYRIRIDPADAITTANPGTVVTLGPADNADDVQRVYLDGALAGQVQGTTEQSFSLGELGPASRMTIEAQNASGGYSWSANVTSMVGRTLTTLFSESHEGYSDNRIGLVRRVVLSASGSPLESCGEAFAPLTCIPADKDRDGALSDRDCNDADDAIRPGAVEILDNGVDENCDGVAAMRPRHASKLTLKRRGGTYTGRITAAGAECLGARRVTLRRVGQGARSFGTAMTRANGAFTIRRSRRVGGRVYAVVPLSSLSTAICNTGRSAQIRG